MLLGPIVRAADAGLACPDWPLCKGKWLPEMDYQVFLEWLHRAVAGLLGVSVLAWGALTFFYDAALRARHSRALAVAIFLLAAQITLGALTISEQLAAWVVSAHLLNALAFWSVLIYACYKEANFCGLFTSQKLTHAHNTQQHQRKMRCFGLLLLFLILLQIFMGVRVSANEAGRVCNTFPACYEEAVIDGSTGTLEFVPQYFPPMRGSIEKHMSHRFLAYLLLGYCGFLLFLAHRERWALNLRRALWVNLILVLMQITLGALNVIFSLPFSITILHSFTAYMIYVNALWLLLQIIFHAKVRTP